MRITALSLTLALLGLASNGCLAQSSTSTSSAAAASSTAIPKDVSQSCGTFLLALNTDPTIQSCTRPLLSATQFYANATEAAKNKKSKNNKNSDAEVDSSATALQDSLGQLCASNTGCQPDIVRSQLSKFWDACGTELKAKNADVIKVYDVLYLINPFHDAVCTKDDDGDYCVLSIANTTAVQEASNTTSTTGTSKRSLAMHHDLLNAAHHHHRRQDSTTSTASDDSTIVETGDEIDGDNDKTNIAFLFLQATSPESVLCSSCSKNVLAAYIAFETSIPYAIGLSNSESLSGQSELYKAMVNVCGRDFTTSVNQLAGTTAFAEVGGAMSFAPIRMGAALAVASVLAAVLLA